MIMLSETASLPSDTVNEGWYVPDWPGIGVQEKVLVKGLKTAPRGRFDAEKVRL